MKIKKKYTSPECTTYEIGTIYPIAQSPDRPSETLPKDGEDYDGPLGYVGVSNTHKC